MRKFFRTAASLALGCALLSTSAFAANSVAFGDDGKLDVTVGATGTEQVAVVIVKGIESTLPTTLSNDNVVYIDQAAATEGTLTINDLDLGEGSYSVFAGYASNTEDEAVYVGGATQTTKNVEISTTDTSITEVDAATIAFSSTGVEGDITWTITKDGSAVGEMVAKVEADAENGDYKFTATQAGTYSITATQGDTTSAAITIEVTKATISIVDSAKQTDIIEGKGEDAGEGEYYHSGVGVGIKANVPTGLTLDKMIWVLDVKESAEGEAVKKFSKAIKINSASGNVAFGATFLADGIASIDGINAIFLATNGNEYCTDGTLNLDEYRAK